jgi:Fe2+ or Zn2+ uptake regulation protein
MRADERPAIMRMYSIYVVQCLCGATLQNHSPHMVCSKCGREIEIQWHAGVMGDEEQAPAPLPVGKG